jgi:eukaryotic-like serine/threonine-protein kinase
MSGDASTPAEDQFTKLLAACDEALAAGLQPPALVDPAAPDEVRQRLERGVACLRLLGQLWPSHPTIPDLQAGVDEKRLLQLGRFQIRAELGHGSFGTVFLAHDPLLGRDVALKVPRAAALATSELRQRFHHEALAAARLDHPNIVPVYEAGTIGDVCFLASPFCPGITLAAWLQKRQSPVPGREAARLVVILAEAVQHAHSRGVLHRDLKPANILLQESSPEGDTQAARNAETGPDSGPARAGTSSAVWQDGLVPRITDFGLAKLLVEGQPHQTGTGMILGTPCYMAPEQAEARNKEITTAADIYALGAILYEIVAGRPPFVADTPLATLEQVRTQEVVPPRHRQASVPRDLETICLKCLNKEPRKRYVSAGGLAEDLRRWLADEPILARPVGLAERLLKWARRRPTAAAVAIITCLAAGLLLLLSLVFNFRLAEEKQATEQALGRELDTNLELTRALARERQTLYFHRVNLAHHEWLANNVGRTRDLLDACPPELRQWEWRYLRRLTESGLATFTGHQDEVTSVAFDASGKRVASASRDGTAILWDADTGRRLQRLPGHAGPVNAVAFSPDSKRLATAGSDKTVKIWDLDTGKVRFTLPGHGREVVALAFSPDGTRLISGSFDETVKIWDAATGQLLRTLPARQGRIYCVAFSADGRLIASGGSDLRIWDASSGAFVARCMADPVEPLIWVGGVAFHPDGKTLASANGNSTVYLWDSATGKPLHILRGHESGVNSVQFSPDGTQLASAAYDQTVRLWDSTTGAPLPPLRGHTNRRVSSVAFAPDGQRLASVGGDRTVRIWDIRTGQEAFTIGSERHYQVDWSPDGRLIATIGSYGDRAVVLWDAATGKPLMRLQAQGGDPYTMAFCLGGRRLASAGADRIIKLWDTTTGKEVPGLPGLAGHSQLIVKLACSPDGQRLASASWDQTIRIWDATTGKLLTTLQTHDRQVNSLKFAPDGGSLASVSEKGAIVLWSVATGQAIRTLPEHVPGVTSVAFDPSGKRLASGGRDMSVKVWNVDTGEVTRTLKGHTGAVLDLAFSRDGQRLASASDDYTVKLWDPASGHEALTLRPQRGSVLSVAFSPDGTRLLAGTNGMIIWDASPGPGR